MPLDLSTKGIERHKQRRAVAAVRNDVDRAIRVMTISYLGAQEEKKNALNQRMTSLACQDESSQCAREAIREPTVDRPEIVPSDSTSVHLTTSQEAIASAEAALAAALRFAAAVGTKASKRTEELVRRAISQQKVLETATEFVESIEGDCNQSWETQSTEQRVTHVATGTSKQVNGTPANPTTASNGTGAAYSIAVGTKHHGDGCATANNHSYSSQMHPPLLQRAITDLQAGGRQHQAYHLSLYGSMDNESLQGTADATHIHPAATRPLTTTHQDNPELFASTGSMSYVPDHPEHTETGDRRKQRSCTAMMQSHTVYPRSAASALTPASECDKDDLAQTPNPSSNRTSHRQNITNPALEAEVRAGTLTRAPESMMHQSPPEPSVATGATLVPEPSPESRPPSLNANPLPRETPKNASAASTISLRADINAALESGAWEVYDNDAIGAVTAQHPDANDRSGPIPTAAANSQGGETQTLLAQRYVSTPGEHYVEPKRDYTHAEWQRRHVRQLETLSRSGVSQAELLVHQVRSANSVLSPQNQSGLPEDIAALSVDQSVLSQHMDALSRMPQLDSRTSPSLTSRGPGSGDVPRTLQALPSPESARSGKSSSPPSSEAHASPLARLNIVEPSTSESRASNTNLPTSLASATSLQLANASMTSASRQDIGVKSPTGHRFSPETTRSSSSSIGAAAIAALACAVGVRGVNLASSSSSSASSSSSSHSSLTSLPSQFGAKAAACVPKVVAGSSNTCGTSAASPVPSPNTPFGRAACATSMGTSDSDFTSMRAALSATSASLQPQGLDDAERAVMLAVSASHFSAATQGQQNNVAAIGSPSRNGSIVPTGPVRFQRLGKIGQGAVGEVYRCSLSENGMNVAVKEAPTSDKKNRDRVVREARIMRELVHPNIICFFGMHATDESVKILMEHAGGGSVHQRLVEAGPLQATLVRNIVLGVLDAIAYMHSKGLVHCDVKCQNILLTAEGQPKLADFGATRWVHPTIQVDGCEKEIPLDATLKRIQSAAAMPISENGKRCDHFTVKWTSPEVLRGEPCTPVADIWSLGCVIVEMVTGRSPWHEHTWKTDIEARNHIAFEDELPKFPENSLTPFAADFVKQCLTRNPKRRPTAAQLLRHPWITSNVQTHIPTPTSTAEASTAVPSTAPQEQQGGVVVDSLSSTDFLAPVPTFEEEDNPQFNKFFARSKQAAEQRPFRQTTFSPGGGVQSITGPNTHSSPNMAMVHSNGWVNPNLGQPSTTTTSPPHANTTIQSAAGLTHASAGLVQVSGTSSVLVPAVLSSPQKPSGSGHAAAASPPLTPFQPKHDLSANAGLVQARLPQSRDLNSTVALPESRQDSVTTDKFSDTASNMPLLQLPVFSSTPATNAQHVGPQITALPHHATVLSGVALSAYPLPSVAPVSGSTPSSSLRPGSNSDLSLQETKLNTSLDVLRNNSEPQLHNAKNITNGLSASTSTSTTTTFLLGESAANDRIVSVMDAIVSSAGPASPTTHVGGGVRLISTIAEENSQRSSSGSSLHSSGYSSMDHATWGQPQLLLHPQTQNDPIHAQTYRNEMAPNHIARRAAVGDASVDADYDTDQTDLPRTQNTNLPFASFNTNPSSTASSGIAIGVGLVKVEKKDQTTQSFRQTRY